MRGGSCRRTSSRPPSRFLEADIPGLGDSEDASQVYSDHLYAQVKTLYYPLAAAVYGDDGADTSAFEQPWEGKF